MGDRQWATIRSEPGWVYRLMVWEYKVRDLLGIDRPENHLANMPIHRGMTVLDWGCGPGRFTTQLARLVGEEGRVIALDVQPLALDIVRVKAARESLANVSTVLLDSYHAPLPGSSADLVLLMHVFHEIGDPDALLREIHRILKPDGFLFMDPGHLTLEAAQERVRGTGLFELRRRQGSDMLFAPRQGGTGHDSRR